MKNIRERFVLILLTFFVVSGVYAARERNYIYLFDCTKSMIGHGGTPKVWEPAKKYMQSDIERYSPGTTIHVIPFQERSLSTHTFQREDMDWGKIEKDLQGYVNKVTYTNICGALSAAEKYIDTNKDNYVYLLTDGVHNIKGESTANVANKLQELCGKYKNTRFYYVVLTEGAIDHTIRDVVNQCPSEFFVDVTKKMNPFGSLDNGSVIYANTLHLKKVHQLQFSAEGEFPVQVSCTDPNFSVSIEGDKIKQGMMAVKISPKKDIKEINETLPETYEFTFEVRSESVEILTPTIRVVITNKVERDLTLLGGEENMGKSEWYDSFLLWGEKKDRDTLKIDLMAKFNEEAQKDGSTVTLKITNKENLKDYQLYFNGTLVKDGLVTLNPKNCADKAELSLVFDKDAKEGKRYFGVEVVDHKNLETINCAPVEEYEGSLRARYDEVWNPLQTILMWLGILILAALVLWFLVLKYVFYSYIKIGSIMVKSPYFSRFKIKGARRVIFSATPVKQSTLNRLFTGKIANNVNPCWIEPLILEPGQNKTLRIVGGRQTYTLAPYDARLKVNTNYTVHNTKSNEKIEILINQ